ncbi:Low-density lipoprotein receptor domain class A, partial [Cooperia oncophora]
LFIIVRSNSLTKIFLQTFPLTCNNSTQFDCQTPSDTQRCIPLEWLCDGLKDCTNGLLSLQDCPLRRPKRLVLKTAGNSRDRSAECEPGLVMCADHTACFPKHWICDGEADCLDGSDESDCAMSKENFLAEAITELCHPGEHRCSGASKCIPVNRTCDGTLDCPEGDDEGPLCKECEVRRTPCEYQCVNTPLGLRESNLFSVLAAFVPMAPL